MTQQRPELIVRLDRGGTLKYAHYGDSGLDLFASEGRWVLPFSAVKVPTGLRLELPVGFEGQVRPRSSMSAAGWVQNLGTVDQQYRGVIQVVLFNPKPWPRRIKQGQKVAQLVVAPVAYCRVFRTWSKDAWEFKPYGPETRDLNEEEFVIEIPQPPPGSTRGDGGFGSTGS